MIVFERKPEKTGLNHDDASAGAQHLCDQLFSTLSAGIPKLERAKSKRWCVLFQEGKTKFAYVRHRVRSGSLEVWSRSNETDRERQRAVGYRERSEIGSGWAEHFPGRLQIANREDLDGAADWLRKVAYPASRIR